MEIEFVGAAQTVTGSKHLIRTSRATILLDCGLVQGHRRESNEANRHLVTDLGIHPGDLNAVILSHAHIDHSGALPLLVKNGYQGPIFATPATGDLCAAMLLDAALIQGADARYINRAIERDAVDMEPVEPLYTEEDVARTLERFDPLPYHRRQYVAPGVHLTFLDAGHVLGSAITILDVDDDGAKTRIVYTGDLGRKNMPILRDPEVPDGAHVLITESTYGDRTHPPIDEMDEQLIAAIRRAFQRGGKIIVPCFALERAQEIVYSLKRLRQAERIPKLPVYIDSPLTVKITEVFKRHPECYDAETRKLLSGHDSPFDFEELHYVSDKEESQDISASSDPAIILSASGMCEAGRVLHHLKATIEDPRNMVIIVGFQAAHTLGRRLVERRPRVRIFGVERDLRAEVVVLNGFSAHADSQDIVEFAEAVRDRGPLRQVALVHGEPNAQAALQRALEARHFPSVRVPAPRERMAI